MQEDKEDLTVQNLKIDVDFITKVRHCKLEKIAGFIKYNGKIKFLGQTVTKFYLFSNVYYGGHSDTDDRIMALFCFEDGSKRCFPLRLYELRIAWLVVGARASQWHIKANPYSWKLGIHKLYNDANWNYYNKLDSKILTKIQELKHQALESVILDLGCGDARLLKKLEREGLSYRLLGIDFSNENIKRAKDGYHGSATFIEDDVFNFNQVLKEHKLQDQSVIVIAEGLLTAFVTKDHFKAVELLQQLAALPNLIHILGGGATMLLFNRFVVEKIGFNVEFSGKGKDAEPQNEFFHLSKTLFPVILDRHLGKLQRSRKLDLSFSINPHQWLAHDQIAKEIKKFDGKINIDISYCEFNLELQKAIKILASQFPAIAWTFYSWNKDSLNFAQLFFNKIALCKIKEVTDSVLILLPKSVTDSVYTHAQSEEKARVVSLFDYDRVEKTTMDKQLDRLESNDPNLTELQFVHPSDMKLNSLECLAVSLKKNTMLKRLRFTDVHINLKMAYILAEGLKENTALIDLSFDQCQIDDMIAIILADAVYSNQKFSLEILSMQNNRIGRYGAVHLCKGIQKIKSLKTFDLSGNQFDEIWAIEIAKLLKINSNLRKKQLSLTIDLHLNSIFTKPINKIIKDYCEEEFPQAQEAKRFPH